jgi:hypothetical protein
MVAHERSTWLRPCRAERTLPSPSALHVAADNEGHRHARTRDGQRRREENKKV